MKTPSWTMLWIPLVGCGGLPTLTETATGTDSGAAPVAVSPNASPTDDGSVQDDGGLPGSRDAGVAAMPMGDAADAAGDAAWRPDVLLGDGGCTSWLGPSLNDASVTYSQCQGPSLVPAPPCAPRFKPAGQSRCTVTDTSVDCASNMSTIGGRPVYWQVPVGSPPAKGWPTVVVFQPSLAPPSGTWSGDASVPLNGLNYIRMEALLLDNGFSVIAPTADNNGSWWDTNFPSYDTSGDATFIPILLDSITGGAFGPADPARLYAAGWSSGGFMTSRMAISYPGRFAALAIHSGGYATCSTVCAGPIPALPSDHPPTLMLHGALDVVVPVAVPQDYFSALVANGTQAEIVVNPSTMHDFLPVAPEAFTCWFLQH